MSYSNTTHALPGTISTNATTAVKSVVPTTADTVKPAAGSTAKSSPAAGDQTTLSLTSTLLANALQGSDVRTEKVASVQQALASGTYNVSSAAVAERLLQTLLG